MIITVENHQLASFRAGAARSPPKVLCETKTDCGSDHSKVPKNSSYNLMGQSKRHRATLYQCQWNSSYYGESHIVVMVEKLDLGHKLIPDSLGHSTLKGASVPPHPGPQSEKGDSVTFDSEPRNRSQDDYPYGGLQAWLVILGAHLPTYTMSLCARPMTRLRPIVQ